MGIFSSIWNKITGHKPKAAPQATPAPTPSGAPPTPGAGPVAAPALPPVDVEAVLSDLAASKGGGGNWRTSIVDLLKLLDLDSQPGGAQGAGRGTERPRRRTWLGRTKHRPVQGRLEEAGRERRPGSGLAAGLISGGGAGDAVQRHPPFRL